MVCSFYALLRRSHNERYETAPTSSIASLPHVASCNDGAATMVGKRSLRLCQLFSFFCGICQRERERKRGRGGQGEAWDCSSGVEHFAHLFHYATLSFHNLQHYFVFVFSYFSRFSALKLRKSVNLCKCMCVCCFRVAHGCIFLTRTTFAFCFCFLVIFVAARRKTYLIIVTNSRKDSGNEPVWEYRNSVSLQHGWKHANTSTPAPAPASCDAGIFQLARINQITSLFMRIYNYFLRD